MNKDDVFTNVGEERYEYNYYALTKNSNKLVFGFEDGKEANKYARKNHYKVFTRNGLKNKKIDPSLVKSWSKKFEEPENAEEYSFK